MTASPSSRHASGAPTPPDASAPLHATSSSPDPEAFCAHVAARVDAQIEAMVDPMVDAICTHVPAYGALESRAPTDLRAGVRTTARLFLRMLVERRDLTEAEVASLQAIAEERAHQGVPRERLRDAMRIANAVGYDHLHAVGDAMAAASREAQVDVRLVSRHLSLRAQDFHARLWEAFSAGYRAGTERCSELLGRLLTEEYRHDGVLADGLRRSDSVLDAPCALALLVALDGASHHLMRRVAHLAEPWPDATISPMLSDPIPHAAVVVGLQRRGWQPLLDALGERVRASGVVAVAERANQLCDVGRVYRGMQRRLVAVPTLSQRPRVLGALQLAWPWLAGLLRAEERFVDVRTVLGTTLARRPDWARKDLEVLRAVRDCGGSATAAAARLGMSVRSVHSHLQAVQRRSGLHLNNPVDLATLGHALWLYCSDPESLPPPGDPAWALETPPDPTRA